MVSPLTVEPPTNSTRTSLKATAPEFRLLGLRPREARLEVIRRALTETAGDVKASEHWAAEPRDPSKPLPQEVNRLAEVAVAGYRLLDPRRRRTLFERVQLLLWSEDDLDGVTGSLWDVASTNDPTAKSGSDESSLESQRETQHVAVRPSERLATENVVKPAQWNEETQVALDAFRSLRRRDRRATALWISVAALAVSLPGAVALVLALI